MALASKNFADLITFTRASGGGRFNASGQYEWLAANVPRIDYDPITGVCLGILIEEQRTNLLLQSAAFDTASWTKYKATVTAAAAVAPDGPATAYKLVENTESGTHFVGEQLNVSENTSYAFSVYIKAAERTVVRLIFENSSKYASADFNLTAGTASVAGGTLVSTAKIESVGGSWYRCTIIPVTEAGTTAYAQVRLGKL